MIEKQPVSVCLTRIYVQSQNYYEMTLHELETIRQSGEGYRVEFKRNVNSDLAKELVAFANADGGRMRDGMR